MSQKSGFVRICPQTIAKYVYTHNPYHALPKIVIRQTLTYLPTLTQTHTLSTHVFTQKHIVFLVSCVFGEEKNVVLF